MKHLIGTIGLPYSGKSTWAREQDNAPIVSPDAIRLELHGQRFYNPAEPLVWALAKILVASLFRAGNELVILDATNTSRERRREWESPEWETIWHVIDASPEECIARARAAGDTEIIPVIERMAKQWEAGWDLAEVGPA